MYHIKLNFVIIIIAVCFTKYHWLISIQCALIPMIVILLSIVMFRSCEAFSVGGSVGGASHAGQRPMRTLQLHWENGNCIKNCIYLINNLLSPHYLTYKILLFINSIVKFNGKAKLVRCWILWNYRKNDVMWWSHYLEQAYLEAWYCVHAHDACLVIVRSLSNHFVGYS